MSKLFLVTEYTSPNIMEAELLSLGFVNEDGSKELYLEHTDDLATAVIDYLLAFNQPVAICYGHEFDEMLLVDALLKSPRSEQLESVVSWAHVGSSGGCGRCATGCGCGPQPQSALLEARKLRRSFLEAQAVANEFQRAIGNA